MFTRKGASLAVIASVLLALAALAGCGGGSATSTDSVALAPSTSASAQEASIASPAGVASVANVSISKKSYEHWLAVEKADGERVNAGHKALAFLISSEWVIGEAAARKISVSQAEIRQQLVKLEKQRFPQAGALHEFLAKSRETEGDLLARVKGELLQSRIAAQVTAGKSGAAASAALSSFQKAFEAHWKQYTTCKPGYVMKYCSEDKSPAAQSENLATTSSSTRHVSPAAGSSGKGAPSAVATPAVFSIESSAFLNGGALPAEYTCDGANISPPLAWSKLPAKTAALVLFVIDDSTTGSAGGIRWIVGDIDPSSKGVAAGKTPAGGVVGANGAGQSSYGGICPPRGKSSSVEFVLYPLRKKIPLSTGFQPSTAEHDYGAGNLLLGSAAVSYATYRRR